jgi:hypothetical protein
MYTKCPQNIPNGSKIPTYVYIPNGHKSFQNITSQVLPKDTKIAILVKHLATLKCLP